MNSLTDILFYYIETKLFFKSNAVLFKEKKPTGQIVNNIILLSIMNENIFHFFFCVYIPFCELNIFPLYIQEKLSFTTTTSWGTEGRISHVFFYTNEQDMKMMLLFLYIYMISGCWTFTETSKVVLDNSR